MANRQQRACRHAVVHDAGGVSGYAPTSVHPIVTIATIAPAELLDRIERGESPAILDVRSPREYAAGHVPGAVNVPFTTVLTQTDAVRQDPSATLVVYCGHGPRAWLAGAALRRRGFTGVTYLRGHMAAWRRGGIREER